MEPRISPEIGDDAAFYSDIGRSLRIRRKELGLSLRVVAASVGISPPMVLKYEAGAKVSSATLVQLAAALDCLPSEFLNVPDPYEQPMIRRLVSAWSRLPNDEARTAAIRLIETLSSDAASPPQSSDPKRRVALRDQNHEAPAIRFGQSAAPKDQPKRRVS
ncbi:helix-turn-helix domain-containing protein [Brevundimonas nasdae]|uniref:helix-turn-helix domain-containing protein n=1 Tax=Brevundimonas nasdae TaxID=172043 RepID=UPI001F0A278E|nr:helix-turn-helix domain-containing protein [Brevundimonas nasdae]